MCRNITTIQRVDLDTWHGDWRPYKEKLQRKEVPQEANRPKVSSLISYILLINIIMIWHKMKQKDWNLWSGSSSRQILVCSSSFYIAVKVGAIYFTLRNFSLKFLKVKYFMFKILNGMVLVKFLLLLLKIIKCWRVMVLRFLYMVVVYVAVWYRLLASTSLVW